MSFYIQKKDGYHVCSGPAVRHLYVVPPPKESAPTETGTLLDLALAPLMVSLDLAFKSVQRVRNILS